MKYFKKIVGTRVYLSPISLDDLDQYTRWVNDKSVSHGLGQDAQVYTLEKEKEFLNHISEKGYHLAIIRHEDDILIGNVSLFNINQISRTAECGIFIGEECNRNKGYGKEALNLIISYGFNALNVNNIMLKVFSFNAMAIACYEKIGFKVIGRRRESHFTDGKYYDEIFMDILSTDFFNKQK